MRFKKSDITLYWSYYCMIALAFFCGCEVPELPANDIAEADNTTIPTSSSTTTASEPSSRGAASKGQTTAEPIRSQRGLALTNWPDGYVWMLAKADATETAEAITAKHGGKVIENAFGKNFDQQKLQTIVCQLEGHPWCIFGWFQREPNSVAAELSAELQADVIMISYSDFSGWQFVDVYRKGETAESFHWGLDDISPGGKWDIQTSVTNDYDGFSMTDLLFFRSKLRQVTEENVKKGDGFADWLLREHDAFLPNDESIVWLDENGQATSPLDTSVFSSVIAIMQ